jgi:hypothetical protein
MGRACSSLNVSLSLVRLPSFECVIFQTNGCSTHPANLWVLTTDRPGRMLRSSDDNRSDGYPSLGECRQLPSLRSVKVGLRKADPAGPPLLSICGKHQILRRQRAVFSDPASGASPGYDDESRRMMVYLKLRIFELRPKDLDISMRRRRQRMKLRCV